MSTWKFFGLPPLVWFWQSVTRFFLPQIEFEISKQTLPWPLILVQNHLRYVIGSPLPLFAQLTKFPTFLFIFGFWFGFGILLKSDYFSKPCFCRFSLNLPKVANSSSYCSTFFSSMVRDFSYVKISYRRCLNSSTVFSKLELNWKCSFIFSKT
jgi:hypothetical protein